jgi:hypothetical protein
MTISSQISGQISPTLNGPIVEYEEALGPAFGETFKYVDGLIDLFEKVLCVEVPIAIFAHLEYDPGFPDGYVMMCE